MTRPYGLAVGLVFGVACGESDPEAWPRAGDSGAPVPVTDSGSVGSTNASHWPLEVVGLCEGENGCAEVSLAIDLGADADLSGDAILTLVVHNFVATNMAEAVINGTTTIPLSEARSPLLRAQGGVSAGAFSIPANTLRPGPNTISFRYLRQVPDTSGYRVLEAAIEIGAARYMPNLEDDDPMAWAPFSNDSASVARGRDYFRNVSRDGGPTCATCHTDSGSDLAYFAFSNRSIVARALFHEFSEEESQDIASYLRTLEPGPVGLLHEPPFQPGPNNVLARGAGFMAQVDDPTFGERAFGAEGLGDDIAWEWAERVDTFTLPSPVQAPSWFRWLPRFLDEAWLDRDDAGDGETVRTRLAALNEEPTLENAQTFMSTVVALGRALFAEGSPEDRIDLYRYGAVKLWEWSRLQGYDQPFHGFPNGTPAYPYEVGFAFFESAPEIPNGWEQVMEWWWIQLSLDYGRGRSNGRRPLNYEDVLIAAEGAGLGPNAITFLHLLGTWEESRGPMESRWGESVGPARLLDVPMRHIADPSLRAALLRRFLRQERRWLEGGGMPTEEHLRDIEAAWSVGCEGLGDDVVDELRALAVEPASSALTACP